MNDLWATICGAALQDALNPCVFMACAVFIAYGLWLKKNYSRRIWPGIAFGLAYASGILIFNFGPAQIFVFQKNVIFIFKIIYAVLAVWAFVSGALFLKDWFLVRGLPVQDIEDDKVKPFANSGAAVTAIILGLALSALATLWPINNYMMLLGNEAFLKGQWRMVMPLLLDYVFISTWPVWFVWAFLNLKNVRPSLLKIICASIFFTASLSTILIFK